jgi:hypothetical protein
LTNRYLIPGGYIVIGDIAFLNTHHEGKIHEQWVKYWDEDEYYWQADETAIAFPEHNLFIDYQQVSSCAGVFVISPI